MPRPYSQAQLKWRQTVYFLLLLGRTGKILLGQQAQLIHTAGPQIIHDVFHFFIGWERYCGSVRVRSGSGTYSSGNL